MDRLKIFIELTRLNKPIGVMLLFWPCSWGLALAYNSKQNAEKLGRRNPKAAFREFNLFTKSRRP